MVTLIDATALRDADGDPAITPIFRIRVRIDAILGRLYENDRQLHFLETHSELITDGPRTPTQRREHGISRVLYTWLRLEETHAEEAAQDIETLAQLGRSEKWKSAVRSWAHITRTDPVMFMQYATYTNFKV